LTNRSLTELAAARYDHEVADESKENKWSVGDFLGRMFVVWWVVFFTAQWIGVDRNDGPAMVVAALLGTVAWWVFDLNRS
jgi:hypothetical protein